MYWTTGQYSTPYTSLTVNGVPQFQAANPAGGVPEGTNFTNEWFNDIQGEFINLLIAAGIMPQPNTPTQVKQALDAMYLPLHGGVIPGHLSFFGAGFAGTWTVPPGVTEVLVTVIAGGGAGGYAPAFAAGGGGGGGGGVYRQLVAVIPGETIAIAVGVGGAGGTSTTAATSGGASSFGSASTSVGGAPGATGSTASAAYGGSAGGLYAAGGGNGFGNSTYQVGGVGGGSLLGSGGAGAVGGVLAGLIGAGFGAGGGGGCGGANGGAGSGGIIILEF